MSLSARSRRARFQKRRYRKYRSTPGGRSAATGKAASESEIRTGMPAPRTRRNRYASRARRKEPVSSAARVNWFQYSFFWRPLHTARCRIVRCSPS
jgi:hypothetical protein